MALQDNQTDKQKNETPKKPSRKHVLAAAQKVSSQHEKALVRLSKL